MGVRDDHERRGHNFILGHGVRNVCSRVKVCCGTLQEVNSVYTLAGGGSELQFKWQNPLRRRTVTVRSQTPGTKATESGALDALEPLDTSQASIHRNAVSMISYIVLDRPDC